MAVPDADKRKLAEQALNGLIIYAEEHAQEMWPPLFHIRKIVGEISAYWNLEKDWQRNFNSRLMLSYYEIENKDDQQTCGSRSVGCCGDKYILRIDENI